MRQSFLSIDDDQPLAICIFDDLGCDVIPLDKFLADSKGDMSKAQAKRYAEALQVFVNDLNEYVEDKELLDE